MAVNDKISQAEYNNIRSKLVSVMQTGSGTYGWNMAMTSSNVAVGNTVSVNEWTNLGYDITNAYKHTNGTTPTLASVTEGGTIRYGTTFTPASTDIPVTQYDQWADAIVANKFSLSSTYAVTRNKGTSSQTWPGPYGSTWTNTIRCTVTVSFSSANAARFFFNSGGELRFTSSRSGGAGSSQNTSWTSILTSAGTRTWGGNMPNTGTSPADNTNFYRCTNSYSVWYSATGSSPYGLNTYRISARTPGVVNNSSGSASTIEFYFEWIDDHVGIAGGFDQVDGTVSLNVTTYEASQVLVPASAGTFSVETPTITIGAITT